MANITFDGQSFLLDGQRIWLISGAVHYTRTPRELWRDRLRSAKQAGLNCIETYVFWNVHEPQPGVFRFDGDHDLRAFVEMIAEEGMWCILRPGPYVCSEWDFGGLPAWLHEQAGMALRQSSSPFLQACARYLDAVMGQVRDLQITSDPAGPILMVQNENEWSCHNDEEGELYLGELSRFLRESGCRTPIINCNNLWQHVPGTIDCWNGWDHLLRDCRQLHVAQPDAPRLVTELWTGWFDGWGREHFDAKSADDVLRKLVEVSAAGAMFNLYMFHGGTNFGFYGGRSIPGPDLFMTTSYDFDAPLTEAGSRSEKYFAVKRIAMFLSHFGSVIANLDPDDHHAVGLTGHSVIHQSGSQGQVTFILRDEDGPKEIDLLLPDGRGMRVPIGEGPAAWVVQNVNLGGVADLDATNLRPWAMVGRRMLVVFGPAGAEGLVVVDGSVYPCAVPAGDEPAIVDADEVKVAVLNEAQVDAAYVEGRTLYVGAGGLDAAGEPLPHPDFASCTVVDGKGHATSRKLPAIGRKPTAPRLGAWQYADQQTYLDGSAPRFAGIEGPRSFEACGLDFGYGWYRLRMKRPRAKKVKLLAPESSDRLHLYRDGQLQTVIGFGPGATNDPVELTLPGGESELIVLADNLGRFNTGPAVGERKGLYGHLMHVAPVRLGRPDRAVSPQIDPFVLGGYIHDSRKGDRTRRPRYTFEVTHRRKSPLVLMVSGVRPRSVVVINGEPIAVDFAHESLGRYVLTPDMLKRGRNQIQLALLDDEPEGFDAGRCVTLYRAEELLTEKAGWWYARWQMPDESDFQPMPSRRPAAPAWYRTHFTAKHTNQPLWIEPRGLSKGQIYLNGRNIGRYFVATATGANVPPQSRYYLPEPWLKVNDENELIIFDEHGKNPSKCRLVYDRFGPYRG